MFSEQAVGPVGCTTDRLHHNKLHQSGFSLMRLHGNRASSVPRRWRQRGEGGGGREGKQNRGGWEKRRGKRWRRERERENRFLLLFHSEDLKSDSPSWSGGRAGEPVRIGRRRTSAGMRWKEARAAGLCGTRICSGPWASAQREAVVSCCLLRGKSVTCTCRKHVSSGLDGCQNRSGTRRQHGRLPCWTRLRFCRCLLLLLLLLLLLEGGFVFSLKGKHDGFTSGVQDQSDASLLKCLLVLCATCLVVTSGGCCCTFAEFLVSDGEKLWQSGRWRLNQILFIWL